MVASTKFGHVVSLYQEGTDPSHGFGYSDLEFAAKTLELWNSLTQETCPHDVFLHGAKCQLCGNKYTLTKLSSIS